MFKYKTEEELSKMTTAERDQYGIDKREYEADLAQKALDKALAPLNDTIGKQAETIKGLQTEVNESKEKANQAIESAKGFTIETIEQKVSKFIQENFDKIKSAKDQGHGFVAFEI